MCVFRKLSTPAFFNNSYHWPVWTQSHVNRPDSAESGDWSHFNPSVFLHRQGDARLHSGIKMLNSHPHPPTSLRDTEENGLKTFSRPCLPSDLVLMTLATTLSPLTKIHIIWHVPQSIRTCRWRWTSRTAVVSAVRVTDRFMLGDDSTVYQRSALGSFVFDKRGQTRVTTGHDIHKWRCYVCRE